MQRRCAVEIQDQLPGHQHRSFSSRLSSAVYAVKRDFVNSAEAKNVVLRKYFTAVKCFRNHRNQLIMSRRKEDLRHHATFSVCAFICI